MEKLVIANTEYILDEGELRPPTTVECKSFVHARAELSARYTKLSHPFFTGEWPQHTNIACWHDTKRFTTPPVPTVRDYDKQRQKWYVTGVFCSLNCAKTWTLLHEPAMSTHHLMLFAQMAREVFGVHDSIPPAQPTQRLAKFGGDMTIEQFRACVTPVRVLVRFPPFVPSPCVLEETDLHPVPLSSNVLDELDRTEPAPNQPARYDIWNAMQPEPPPPPAVVPPVRARKEKDPRAPKNRSKKISEPRRKTHPLPPASPLPPPPPPVRGGLERFVQWTKNKPA